MDENEAAPAASTVAEPAPASPVAASLTAPAVVEVAPVPNNDAPEEVVSLTEACRLISRTSRELELIAAFNFEEERDGHLADTEANFRKRFSEFHTRPVA